MKVKKIGLYTIKGGAPMKLRYAQANSLLLLYAVLFSILLTSVAVPLTLFSESAGLPRWVGTVVALVGGIIGAMAVHRFERRLVRTRFNAWHAEWVEATKLSSSTHDIVRHPAYLAIIEMGHPALPFIFEELNKGLEHWFIALAEITGVNPANDAPAGDLEAMRRAWLEWGRSNGYLK